MSFADDDPDPLTVALELLEDAGTSAAAMPNVARLLPLQATCEATLEGIEQAIGPLLEKGSDVNVQDKGGQNGLDVCPSWRPPPRRWWVSCHQEAKVMYPSGGKGTV